MSGIATKTSCIPKLLCNSNKPGKFLAVGLAVVLCGCSPYSLNPNAVSASGLSPSVESLDFKDVAANQDLLITQLVTMANLPSKPQAHDSNWELVMKSGMSLIDDQCNDYLGALFAYDKNQHKRRTDLTATGAVTAVLMGLSGTPAAPIAATAAVFGYAGNLFDAQVNSVLFQLGAPAVQSIVNKSQGAYRTAVMANLDNYQSQPDVMLGLQGYLQLCTPVTIESAIDQASATANFQTQSDQAKNPQPLLTQTSTAPVDLGTVGAANYDQSKAVTQVLHQMGTLHGNQLKVMAQTMLPTWNAWTPPPAFQALLTGNPTYKSAYQNWQKGGPAAQFFMAQWLTQYNGSLAPWTAALSVAESSPP